MWQPLLTTW